VLYVQYLPQEDHIHLTVRVGRVSIVVRAWNDYVEIVGKLGEPGLPWTLLVYATCIVIQLLV
jgi:hypothetical protein